MKIGNSSVMAAGLALCLVAAAAERKAKMTYVQDENGARPKPFVAVRDVCAWPNLTVLDDGAIIATIHNQPAHLKRPADVDCYASVDGGRTWTKRGTPAPRDTPEVARGNVAAGRAANGDLVVVTSGWSDPTATDGRGTVLPPVVSRSADGGRTWTRSFGAFPADWPAIGRRERSPEGYLIPFGDILPGKDGRLRVGMYGREKAGTFVYTSDDDGKTWADPVVISARAVIHEPALLHLGDGHWLLAARFTGLDLYTSADDARSWQHRGELAGANCLPGHLLRLKDGSVLLSYGNRNDPKGVDLRRSTDAGKTWSEPLRIVDFEGDGGYPSSVQLPDGRVLTAYYARKSAAYDGYHMGVVIWDPSRSFAD